MIFILIYVESYTMLHMIFQYGWELVLIQRISFGFEAILGKNKIFQYLFFRFYLLSYPSLLSFFSANDRGAETEGAERICEKKNG